LHLAYSSSPRILFSSNSLGCMNASFTGYASMPLPQMDSIARLISAYIPIFIGYSIHPNIVVARLRFKIRDFIIG